MGCEDLRPGLVYDSNGRILADAVVEAGGEPRFLGAFRDDEDALRAGLAEALRGSDLVLLSGGTSKGEGDLNARVVSELDPGIVVHGVALKPGKPICLAASRGNADAAENRDLAAAEMTPEELRKARERYTQLEERLGL